MSVDTLIVIALATPATALVPDLEGHAWLYRNTDDSNKLWLKFWNNTDYSFGGGVVSAASQTLNLALPGPVNLAGPRSEENIFVSAGGTVPVIPGTPDEIYGYAGAVFSMGAAPNLKALAIWQKAVAAFFSAVQTYPSVDQIQLIAVYGSVQNIATKFPNLKNLDLAGEVIWAGSGQVMPESLQGFSASNSPNLAAAAVEFPGTAMKGISMQFCSGINDIPDLSTHTAMQQLIYKACDLPTVTALSLPAATSLTYIDFSDNALDAAGITALVNLVVAAAAVQPAGLFNISGGTNAVPTGPQQTAINGLPVGWVHAFNT